MEKKLIGLPQEERSIRTARMLGDPEFLDRYCAHIANGGDGARYCFDMGLRYSDVLRWVGQDEERKIAVSNAETAGARWFITSIIGELRNIGLADIGQAYDSLGRLLPIEQMSPAIRAGIVAIESEELYDGQGASRQLIGYTKRVKFSDKLKALELLGKHLQMFIDTSRVIHQGRVTLEDLVMQSQSTQPEVSSGETAKIDHGGETSSGNSAHSGADQRKLAGGTDGKPEASFVEGQD